MRVERRRCYAAGTRCRRRLRTPRASSERRCFAGRRNAGDDRELGARIEERRRCECRTAAAAASSAELLELARSMGLLPPCPGPCARWRRSSSPTPAAAPSASSRGGHGGGGRARRPRSSGLRAAAARVDQCGGGLARRRGRRRAWKKSFGGVREQRMTTTQRRTAPAWGAPNSWGVRAPRRHSGRMLHALAIPETDVGKKLHQAVEKGREHRREQVSRAPKREPPF